MPRTGPGDRTDASLEEGRYGRDCDGAGAASTEASEMPVVLVDDTRSTDADARPDLVVKVSGSERVDASE